MTASTQFQELHYTPPSIGSSHAAKQAIAAIEHIHSIAPSALPYIAESYNNLRQHETAGAGPQS